MTGPLVPWLTSALVLCTVLGVLPVHIKAQNNTATPKLIIGIAVDQLRTDYLYSLQHRFTESGFRRLIEQGIVYEQVTFDLDHCDGTAALATLATGCYPYQNGVPAASVYDPQMLRRQSIFFDRQYVGVNTSDCLSPHALMSTTLADELKVASYKAARIYSIASEPEQAIIAGGHTADCAIWIDDKTYKWASSSYYPGWPSSISKLNNQPQPLFTNLKETVWKPIQYSGGHVDILPYHYETQPFEHQFFQYRKPNMPSFETSPMVNDAVLELSKFLLKSVSLGKGVSPDMLQVTLYAGTWMQERPDLYAEELQDTYLRLDQSLGAFLDAVDRQVGLENTFIYLMGTGLTNPITTTDERTLTGQFYPERCTSLLNSHLISRYGQAQWVTGYDSYQIFLNHKEIESRKLSLAEVQHTAQEFVTLFSGIDEVVTSHNLIHADFSQRIRRMRNGYNRLTGGDLIITLQPGWSVHLEGQDNPLPQQRHDIAPGPVILFAPATIKAECITTPVEATTIAPTVARMIRIRAPSGCGQAPLRMR